MKRFFLAVVYLFFLWGLYFVLDTYLDEIKSLYQSIAIKPFLLLLVLQFPIITLMSYPPLILLALSNIHIRPIELISLAHLSNLLNHLLPYRPGIMLRWLYLKRLYNIRFSSYFFNTFIYFISFFTLSVLLFMLLSLIITPDSEFDIPVGMMQGLLTLFVIAFAVIFLGRHNLLKFYAEQKNYILKLLKEPKIIIHFFASLIFSLVFISYGLQITFWALNEHIPFLACLWISCGLLVSNTIHVTPGNIGVGEIVVASLTYHLYQNFAIGFAALALFRFSQFIVAAIIGLPCLSFFIKKAMPENWFAQLFSRKHL